MLIKSTVKWGGLEPKNVETDVGANGGVRITINLGSTPQDTRTIEAPIAEIEDATPIEN